MCSINGFNFKDERLIQKMNQITKHRGPDGTGIFLNERISLGHNRLAIIDTTDMATQPMKSVDGNLTIVFNGEIYNFKELKKELSGYQFRTESDTEVILAAYQKWGNECVKKFNGIFAFAIWNVRDKELFLARDNIGVKPLYYFWDRKRFIFASEIKAILEHDISRTLNKEAFRHYLRVLYVPEPMTMFDWIHKLPPASFAVLKNGKLVIKKYWEESAPEYFQKSKKEITEELREKIFEAVGRQLVSDRPLGVYLSGGIDSSIVLHSMSEIRSNIDTFSVGFELEHKEQSEKFNTDFNLARKTAAHYGTNHHEVLVSAHDVVQNFEKAVWHLDEPISNPTAIAMMKLAGFAKQSADVVLGGDGGDELFGGYERYRLSRIASLWGNLPSVARAGLSSISKKAAKLNTPSGIERFALFMFQKDEELKSVIRPEFFDADAEKTKHFFEEKYFSNISDTRVFEGLFMETDRKSWLVDFSLMLTDKMSMSAGLEARVPFLDRELVEFAARIPLKYKVSPFNTKIILKDTFRGSIPDFLFGEPKRGWFSPGAKWLRYEEMSAFAREILSPDYYSETARLIDFAEANEMLSEHINSKEYHLNTLWALLTFQIWAKQYNIRQ